MLILEGESEQRLELSSGNPRQTIGRDCANDLVIVDDSVSGFHAQVFCEDGQVEIIDLGSTNGTRVDGMAVQGRVRLAPWQKISFGTVEFEVIDSEARRPTRAVAAISDDTVSPQAGRTAEEPEAADSAPALLELRSGGAFSAKIPVSGTVMIGRGPDNDVVLTSDQVSQRHARLECTAETLIVEDLGSTNGTWANGQRIGRQQLRPGDTVSFDEIAYVVAKAPGAPRMATVVNPVITEREATLERNGTLPEPEVHEPTNRVAVDAAATRSAIEPHADPAASMVENRSDPHAAHEVRANEIWEQPVSPPLDRPRPRALGPEHPEPIPASQEPPNSQADGKASPTGGVKESPRFWPAVALSRFADFSGRSRRKEYWWFMLFYNVLLYGAFALDMAVGNMYGGFIWLVILVLFLPGLAVTVRRLHDTDKSGWWFLLVLIPYIGGLIVFIMMLFDGTPGMNRFGPDPQGRA